MDTGTPPSTEGNPESDQTTPTEVTTESPTSAPSIKADIPTPQPGANPEKSGQEAAPKSAVQPDAGSVQSPETAAPATAISSAATAGGGGGAGAAGGASAGGGDVETATVDEEAEANAMEKRLAEVAPETDTESQQLSSAEKDVALAALAEEPATGSLPAGGGGGGGAIAESAPPPAPPNVSQADPAAALGAVSGLPPAQLVSALGGVTAAVSNDVGKQKSELAANPPTADTLPGTGKSAVVKADSGGDNPKPVAKKAEGQEKPVPEPKPLPPEKAPPQVSAPAPAVQGNEEGKLSDADISNMKASVTRLPVSDPGANQVSAGPAPKLALEGNADPQKAQEQRAELETSLTEAQAKGQQELAKPTGVENIQPTIPQKTLKAQITGGAGGGAAGAAAGAGAALATGAGGDGMADAASIFAQQEKGGEIQAAAAQAQSDLAAKKQDHATKVAEEQATAQQEVEQLKQDNIAQQAQERTKAKGEVAELQGQWSKEQDDLVSQSRQEGDTLVNEGLQEVETKQAEGDAEAAKEIEKGETEAETERQKGEAQAAAEKQKGEQESSGLFGWLASKAKAFFDGIKKAIKKAFEAARAAMRKAIEAAKKLAAAAIEKARQGIVAVIRRVGDALIALGDTLLAKWPGLRDKWRSAIAKKVQQAEDTVNKLAENLNQGIQKTLDVLGGALDAALGLLEKGMLAVVSVYQGVVMGAIKFGEGIAKALGAFAVLAKDIAANPGQWISNLGAAVSDGIRNHLWSAFKEQVQTWFNQKLEAVLGLGAAVWKILTQGGIAMAEVGKMAWTAVKQALPTIIIGVLLERLVSMIVPAAGAVLAIIQGLQAAWGTVSQIIQAFGRFIEFLKAIKTGAAGPQFGALLASAAIVLLDFITNFIIVKIAKAARKVAGKLKGLAKSLMKRFKGKKGRQNKKQNKNNKENRDEKRKRKVQERFDKGIASVEKYKAKFRGKQSSSLRFQAGLALIRVRYRFSKLQLVQQGNGWVINAVMNPRKVVGVGHSTLLKVNELNPSAPTNAVPPLSKAFGKSARGSTRYYCTDSEGNRWYWRPKDNSPTKGTWIKANDNKNKEKAEAAARDYLASNNPKFISLVEDDKGLTSGGLDAGGLDPTDQEERLVLGESKHSGGQHPEYIKYVPPELVGTRQKSGHYRHNPLSATTDNLTANIASLRNQVIERKEGAELIKRVDAALRAGKVTIIYFLAGNATISGNTRKKVEERIRNELSNLLKNRFKMSKTEIKGVIGNISVEIKKTSI